MRRTRRGPALLVVVLSSLPLWPVARASAAEPDVGPVYTFGVVPQFEQRRLYTVWTPITEELARRTGLRFKLVTNMSVEDFDRASFREDFDFAYVNPYHALKVPGYLPLVADRAPLHGVLVVRRDGPIKAVDELEGKTIAFPSPNALGASLLMRSDLERVHHVRFTPLYVKTHSSVYLHVAKGLADAGGGVEKTLGEQKPEVRDALRVLYTTRVIPSHPICAHRRVAEADREKVRRAFLAMDAASDGRALLAPVPTQQLVVVTRDTYTPMTALDLDAYWVDLWKEERGR